MDDTCKYAIEYLAEIHDAGRRVGEIARGSSHDTRLPGFARWTLGDLVAHLAGVHWWATEIVSRRTASTSGFRRPAETGAALCDAFDDGVTRLCETLAVADLDASCWNFSPGTPNTVGFWARRQAFETIVHRRDAESVGDRGLSRLTPQLATDGIDELLATFTASRGKQRLDGQVALRCIDTGHVWQVTPAGKAGRVLIERCNTLKADVDSVMAGPADLLFWAVWHRVPSNVQEFEYEGDPGCVRAFVDGPICP